MFFSSPVSRDLLQAIKSDGVVLSRIISLKEVSSFVNFVEPGKFGAFEC